MPSYEAVLTHFSPLTKKVSLLYGFTKRTLKGAREQSRLKKSLSSEAEWLLAGRRRPPKKQSANVTRHASWLRRSERERKTDRDRDRDREEP
jgi:hypothetical protein